MKGRIMWKKLLMMLMCICVLIAGCSKKPSTTKRLKSMTIGEVRQLVFEWNEGKLPEQAYDLPDETRNELELLKKQYEEQKAKSEEQFNLLRKQRDQEYAKYSKEIDLLKEQKTEQWRKYTRYHTDEEEGYKEGKAKWEILNKQWIEQSERHKQQQERYDEKLNLLRGQSNDLQRKIVAIDEQLQGNNSVETFYKVFGKPKEKSLIGDSYYFQYRCEDGIVILDIAAGFFDRDRVVISDVSVL